MTDPLQSPSSKKAGSHSPNDFYGLLRQIATLGVKRVRQDRLPEFLGLVCYIALGGMVATGILVGRTRLAIVGSIAVLIIVGIFTLLLLLLPSVRRVVIDFIFAAVVLVCLLVLVIVVIGVVEPPEAIRIAGNIVDSASAPIDRLEISADGDTHFGQTYPSGFFEFTARRSVAVNDTITINVHGGQIPISHKISRRDAAHIHLIVPRRVEDPGLVVTLRDSAHRPSMPAVAEAVPRAPVIATKEPPHRVTAAVARTGCVSHHFAVPLVRGVSNQIFCEGRLSLAVDGAGNDNTGDFCDLTIFWEGVEHDSLPLQRIVRNSSQIRDTVNTDLPGFDASRVTVRLVSANTRQGHSTCEVDLSVIGRHNSQSSPLDVVDFNYLHVPLWMRERDRTITTPHNVREWADSAVRPFLAKLHQSFATPTCVAVVSAAQKSVDTLAQRLNESFLRDSANIPIARLTDVSRAAVRSFYQSVARVQPCYRGRLIFD